MLIAQSAKTAKIGLSQNGRKRGTTTARKHAAHDSSGISLFGVEGLGFRVRAEG